MYETVIGIEIHAQLKTKTKMFCDSKNDPDETRPNVNICPVCMGHPGTLPTINKKAVEHVVMVGHALNSEIAKHTKFDRKNYFYPDIPKGYQISQYDLPICAGGNIDINGKKIRITRVHLEEDTAKSIHGASGHSFVDFNRASAPLMELVTEPDISSCEEAKAFCEELQKILQYLDVSDANMEKGQMRCEVNISIRKKGVKEYGTKVEIKNLNSFRAVKDAVEFEEKRQAELLEKGEKIIQETRGWDENKKSTFSQRLKESAHDYRYFPEPDLPAMELGVRKGIPTINIVDVEAIKAALPELPRQKIKRFTDVFGISEKDANILTEDKHFSFYFENVVSELRELLHESGEEAYSEKAKSLIQLAVNYLNTDLKKILKDSNAEISDVKMLEEDFAELIFMTFEKKITSAAAKAVLLEMVKTGADPSHIVEEKGLSQLNDPSEISKVAKEVVEANAKPVADYKAGNINSLQFLLGQIMAKTKGKANPAIAKEVLEELLNSL
ncbi:Asp-tRNA(Asn)/Glu-tRNA(Gln) amidotransferase subunit GatB [Candidatus Azambacteria bacterium]|nr:Asp-tRNA(Asn)/Glu-tRNA(Gln) amidotransferase subunit GatB [Candidatus Azambacteria bacterium]